MQNSFSFEDAFRKIVQVNDDLLSGRIDVQTAAVHHAGSVALDKLLNTAIKVRLVEMNSGKSIPAIGGTMIFERPAIESDAMNPIDGNSIKSLSSVAVDTKKEPKTRLPVIGICGMSAPQQSAIAGDVSEFAELEFWHDGGIERLKSMAKKCDIIFVNRGQVSHMTTQILDAQKANYVMTKQNGKTSMVEAIKEYFKVLVDKS